MAATEAQLPKRARRQLEGVSQQQLPAENYQDGLLVLEIVLQQLHDAPTLARLAAVSTDCSRLVQLHCKQHVCVCVSTELQRQQQRWELDPAGHGLQDADEKVADEKVVQSKPLEWLCSLAGRDTMSRPQVAHAVVGTLRFLDVAVVDAVADTLALAGLQLEQQLVYDAAKSHTPHLERLARALHHRSPFRASVTWSGTNLSSIFAGVLLDFTGLIPLCKEELTMENLPALLQIACTYSSASTVEKLVDTAIEHLSDNMSQPGASKEHVDTTCHQLLRGCIVRYGAEKMAALARLPVSHSLGATEVLGLLQEVPLMHPSQHDADKQSAALIGCLTRFQGAKAISAKDLHGTIVAVLAKPSITSDVPSLLLTLPGAAGFSVPEVMQLISAVARDTCRINRDKIDDESWQLLQDLDGLLSTRNVTRADVRQLLRELLSTRAIIVVLRRPAIKERLSLLQPADIEVLLHQAISRRSFMAAEDMLLTRARTAAAQLAPTAVAGLFTAVMKQQLDIYEWCDKDKTEEESDNMQAVLEMLLALPPAAHFSTDDAEALLQSVLHKQLPTALTWLRSKCAPVETAWAEINPVQLKDYILSMLSDDDPSLTDSKQLADALQHPQLQQLSADQLSEVVSSGFNARVRASKVLDDVERERMRHQALPGAAEAGDGRGDMHQYWTQKTAPAADILTNKISTSRLSQLLQLPAISGASFAMVQSWIDMSVWLRGDCLEELLNIQRHSAGTADKPSHEAAAESCSQLFVTQQLMHLRQLSADDASLLERAFSMPADSAFMRHLTPGFLHSVVKTCIERWDASETMLLLVKLPGAQQMTEGQVESLLRYARRSAVLEYTDYQGVLMQLPHAATCLAKLEAEPQDEGAEVAEQPDAGVGASCECAPHGDSYGSSGSSMTLMSSGRYTGSAQQWRKRRGSVAARLLVGCCQ